MGPAAGESSRGGVHRLDVFVSAAAVHRTLPCRDVHRHSACDATGRWLHRAVAEPEFRRRDWEDDDGDRAHAGGQPATYAAMLPMTSGTLLRLTQVSPRLPRPHSVERAAIRSADAKS